MRKTKNQVSPSIEELQAIVDEACVHFGMRPLEVTIDPDPEFWRTRTDKGASVLGAFCGGRIVLHSKMINQYAGDEWLPTLLHEIAHGLEGMRLCKEWISRRRGSPLHLRRTKRDKQGMVTQVTLVTKGGDKSVWKKTYNLSLYGVAYAPLDFRDHGEYFHSCRREVNRWYNTQFRPKREESYGKEEKEIKVGQPPHKGKRCTATDTRHTQRQT